MYMKKSLFLAALVCGIPCVALAEHDMEEKLKKMDENGDGSISMAEHAKFAEMKFKKCDENGDGKLDKSEQEKMLKKKDHD